MGWPWLLDKHGDQETNTKQILTGRMNKFSFLAARDKVQKNHAWDLKMRT